MSTHDPSQRRSSQRGPSQRGEQGLRRFRVSPLNAIFVLLFFTAGVLFLVFDTWLTGVVFLVAGVLQYSFAVFARRGSPVSDVWRTGAFEPSDERDRAILQTASAFVAYVVGTGSMVVFLVALLFFREEGLLVVYLALQAIVINVLWGVSIWVVARRS